MAGTVVVAAKTDDLCEVVVVNQEVMRHYMCSCKHVAVKSKHKQINISLVSHMANG